MANKLSRSTEHSMLVRVLTSLAFALLTVPCAILGGWFMVGLSLVLVGFGSYELLTMPRRKFPVAVWIATFVFVYAIVYSQFFLDADLIRQFFSSNLIYLNGLHYSVPLLLLFAYLIVLFLVEFFCRDFSLSDLLYLFVAVFLVSFGFQSIIYLRFVPDGMAQIAGGAQTIWGGFAYNLTSCLFMWWVLFGVWLSDIGAYFVGVFFGKHPMNVRISPHKTWEGFAGGVLFSFAFAFIYVAIVNSWLRVPLIPGVIDVYKDPSDWGWVALSALMFVSLDNIGGFLFSALKRKYDAKDWGFILPGHGGIIDRFDGVMVTSIAASIVVTLLGNPTSFLA